MSKRRTYDQKHIKPDQPKTIKKSLFRFQSLNSVVKNLLTSTKETSVRWHYISVSLLYSIPSWKWQSA